jgi:glutathione S-transferase
MLHLVIGNKAYSSWSLRPWMLMTARGIPFEETVIAMYQADTKARMLSFGPTGKCPVLVDGDVTVWESLAIMEYLADRFPSHAIWPRDQKARAHARATSAEMHAGFQKLRGECPMVITKRYAPRQRSPEVIADVARVTAVWREARERFGSKATGADAGPFLYGSFTAADGMYAPVVTRLNTYSIDVDPVSRAYMDALTASPAYRDWLEDAIAETWVLGENDEPVIEDLRARKA